MSKRKDVVLKYYFSNSFNSPWVKIYKIIKTGKVYNTCIYMYLYINCILLVGYQIWYSAYFWLLSFCFVFNLVCKRTHYFPCSHLTRDLKSHSGYWINVVSYVHLQNVTGCKYEVAENVNTQVKYKYLNIVAKGAVL